MGGQDRAELLAHVHPAAFMGFGDAEVPHVIIPLHLVSSRQFLLYLAGNFPRIFQSAADLALPWFSLFDQHDVPRTTQLS